MNVLVCHLSNGTRKVLSRAVSTSGFYLLVKLDDVCYKEALNLS